MYASIRRYKSYAAPEVLAKVRESFVPLISDAEGFVAYHLIQMEGTFLSITIFETEQAAEESNAMAQNWIKENIPSLIDGELEFNSGELVVSKTI